MCVQYEAGRVNSEIPKAGGGIVNAAKWTLQNQAPQSGIVHCEETGRASANRSTQDEHISYWNSSLVQHVFESRLRVLVNGHFVRTDPSAGPIASVVDQHQVRADSMKLGGFFPYHVFQDVTVAVEGKNHLLRWRGSGNPPCVQIVSRVH